MIRANCDYWNLFGGIFTELPRGCKNRHMESPFSLTKNR
jgi:hypothetical protein